MLDTALEIELAQARHREDIEKARLLHLARQARQDNHSDERQPAPTLRLRRPVKQPTRGMNGARP